MMDLRLGWVEDDFVLYPILDYIDEDLCACSLSEARHVVFQSREGLACREIEPEVLH